MLSNKDRQETPDTESLAKVMREGLEEFRRKFTEAMNNVTIFYKQAFEKAEVDAQDISPLLHEANLWLPPSMGGFHLLHRLHDVAKKDGANADLMKVAFVDYFEEDDWHHLNEIVTSWHDNPHFSDRMPIIQDALEAHTVGKYTLVVPTILAQVEGLLRSIFGDWKEKIHRLATKAIQDEQGDFLQIASKDVLLAYIQSGALYGYIEKKDFKPDKYPKYLKSRGQTEEQTINRHAILHGVQIRYASKENSLRVFLLLDVLYWMKRDEWDEEWKWFLEN